MAFKKILLQKKKKEPVLRITFKWEIFWKIVEYLHVVKKVFL